MSLLTQLNMLESSGLLRLATFQPELEYLFRHALMQDAAYGSLLKNDRKQLHLATCQALEKLYADQTDDLAATLAYHYEKADDNERAAHYFQRAGNLARDRYANVEALGFYQSAIRLITSASSETSRYTLAQLYEDMGDLSEIFGQHEMAREQFATARSFLSGAEPFACARLHRKTANTWGVQNQSDAAFQACAEAEAALGAATDTERWQQEWLQIQLARHWPLYALNRVAELQSSIDRIRPVLKQYGTPVQQVNFYTGLVYLMHRLHRYASPPETIAYGEAGLAAAYRSGNLRSIADAEWVLGVAYLLGSQLDAAETHLQASLRLVEQVGDLVTEIRSLTYLVVLYRRKGNLVTVRALLPRLSKAATDGQIAIYVAAAKATQAWLNWRDGQLAEAEACGQKAIAAWQKLLPQVYPFQWQALWLLIATKLRLGDIAEAVHYTQKLLAPEQQAVPLDIQPVFDAALQAWAEGQREMTRRQLEQAVTLAQAQGYL